MAIYNITTLGDYTGTAGNDVFNISHTLLENGAARGTIIDGLGGNDRFVVDYGGDTGRAPSLYLPLLENVENLVLQNGSGRVLRVPMKDDQIASLLASGTTLNIKVDMPFTSQTGAVQVIFSLSSSGELDSQLLDFDQLFTITTGIGAVPLDTGFASLLYFFRPEENQRIFGTERGETFKTSGFGTSTVGTVNGRGGDDVFEMIGFVKSISGGDGTDRLELRTLGNTLNLNIDEGWLADATKRMDVDGIEDFSFRSDQSSGNLKITMGDNDAKLQTPGGFDVEITGGAGDLFLTGSRDARGQVTLFGGAGVEKITASDFDDLLNGGGGDDTFLALGGDDVVNGGAGDDSVYGHGGNDTIRGDAGNDTLRGGEGDDTISGGAGNDDLRGGNGNDIVRGGDGDDTILAGSGNDTVYGDAGFNILYGESGENFLYVAGSGANDPGYGNVYGGDGTDTIYGGNADDALFGLAGNDVLYGRGGDDVVSGGFGDDIVDGGGGNDVVNDGAGNDRLFGRDGDDRLTDTSGNDFVSGGNGNDTIYSLGGIDVIYGGAGNDRIELVVGEKDTVYGEDGDDSITTSTETASIADIHPGAGFNNIFLRSGENTIHIHGAAPGRRQDQIINFTPDGSNKVDLRAFDIYSIDLVKDLLTQSSYQNTALKLYDGVQDVTVVWFNTNGLSPDDFGADDFVLATPTTFRQIGTDARDHLYGSDVSDRLFGGDGSDVLYGSNGNDGLNGGDGNDELHGGAGRDLMVGGAGNDRYWVENAADRIVENANDGYDIVYATVSNLTLSANVEKLIFTDTGNHVGRGNASDNVLNGNAGSDKFIIDAGGDDTFSGGNGMDAFDARSSETGVRIYLNNQDLNGGATAGDFFASIETFIGSSTAGDIMKANPNGRARFAGDGGDDVLWGSNSIDYLRGDAGNDDLRGGAGRDTILGGTGNDDLYGGSGRDQFRFVEVQFGQDTIHDYQDGLDYLRFYSAVADEFSDFTISGNGTSSVRLTLASAPSNFVEINGVNNSTVTLTDGDFMFY
ncbi:hypothetical protein ACFQ14_00425 [Pseudahrensia aquimaris]|uniref:Ca2+-binding protein, RTX toxin-related n=1 Tax=Pseudahrensia aquimaris TaxID=744461 RepID=A0ABW3FDJ0_9HYPH